MKQLLSVVKYLESKDICHLNLKPENILIDTDLSIKVCGFGSSLNMNWVKRKIDSIFPMVDKSITDPYCVAPELLKVHKIKIKHKDEDTVIEESKIDIEKRIEKSSTRADIWSCGCILYNMLTSIPPYFNEDPDKLIYSI